MLISENKGQALRLFDSLVDEYADDREQMPLFREQINFMLSALGHDGGRILDLGCAAGSEVRSLRDRDFTVIGVDLSLDMLNRAQQKFRGEPRTWFCRCDAEVLPFASDSMDGVVCLGLLEYVEDYAPTLREVHRVLRPNGRAIFAVPTRWSAFMTGQRFTEHTIAPLWRLGKRLLRSQTTTTGTVPQHQRNLCVPRRFRELLRDNGLRVDSTQYSAYLIYPLDRFPSLNLKVSSLFRPLCHVPLLRGGASVYMVAAQKTQD